MQYLFIRYYFMIPMVLENYDGVRSDHYSIETDSEI